MVALFAGWKGDWQTGMCFGPPSRLRDCSDCLLSFFFFLSTALQSDNIYNTVYVLRKKYTLVSLRVILTLAWFSGYNNFELSPHWPATAVAWPRTLEIVSNNPVGLCLAWTFILNKAAGTRITSVKSAPSLNSHLATKPKTAKATSDVTYIDHLVSDVIFRFWHPEARVHNQIW